MEWWMMVRWESGIGQPLFWHFPPCPHFIPQFAYGQINWTNLEPPSSIPDMRTHQIIIPSFPHSNPFSEIACQRRIIWADELNEEARRKSLMNFVSMQSFVRIWMNSLRQHKNCHISPLFSLSSIWTPTVYWNLFGNNSKSLPHFIAPDHCHNSNKRRHRHQSWPFLCFHISPPKTMSRVGILSSQICRNVQCHQRRN